MEIVLFVVLYFVLASVHFAFAYIAYSNFLPAKESVVPYAVFVSIFFPICVWFVFPWWLIRRHFSEKISKDLRPIAAETLGVYDSGVKKYYECPSCGNLFKSVSDFYRGDRCPKCWEILAKSEKHEQLRPEDLSFSNYD